MRSGGESTRRARPAVTQGRVACRRVVSQPLPTRRTKVERLLRPPRLRESPSVSNRRPEQGRWRPRLYPIERVVG
ncbi:hypothetical protein MILUP08_42787 [Micromonospora lupini str. Lupac 08]|uniref:Uncharacterized protein n=1 Tax=Micromonospora lupini str. Lupac 08 TaxID=1150864 RepID=I0L209_9ACTN|nr:hypothetical protein MILUP08_42787 [Micromonospora lupini str. Lupac 08]